MIPPLIESWEFRLDMFVTGKQRLLDKIEIGLIEIPRGLHGFSGYITGFYMDNIH